MKLELPGKKVQVTCEGIIYLSEAKRIRSTRSIHSTHFTHSIHAREPRSEVGREASATYKGAKRGGCHGVTETGGYKGNKVSG